ncbi:hypothetical protein [Sphingomonas morindae]|uniref:Uncharacterized protein n=1 Tax=Sphingomonas morindae TaxID=1541170 RepID=A0ABY4X5Y2_9SPHN|nr:hypothetical protein [Sphingomonas morindae]USI72297.1 hypothetical protein LHA26_13490 [Sphingomonas morindae]
MVHLTLAIADFMGLLIGAALWAGASIGAAVLLGGVVMLGAAWGLVRLFRRR